MGRVAAAATASTDGVATTTTTVQTAIQVVPVRLGAAAVPGSKARGRDIGGRAAGAGVARGRPEVPQGPVILGPVTVGPIRKVRQVLTVPPSREAPVATADPVVPETVGRPAGTAAVTVEVVVGPLEVAAGPANTA